MTALEHVDVIIVGAGLSGVGAAVHLQKNCPSKRYVILEGRERIGGTWDLFQYPGIRSDSDMYTLGYAFKPWSSPKAIADGPSILSYVKQTAEEEGVLPHVRFNHHVKGASFSSAEGRWTVTHAHGQMTCQFLFVCAGYYDYDAGYEPAFAGADTFKGRIVHPQKWTPDIDYEGKKVVVIGSGATAVTLVPELAKKAEHVTMLQRSPTYVVSLPGEDRVANWLRGKLPAQLAYGVTRWKNVLLNMALYQASRAFPRLMKKLFVAGVRKAAGDAAVPHFTPTYDPWDQRLCLVPDDDLFIAVREGKASVVTDHVDRFVSDGILLKSGRTLAADMIVTATGLKVKVLGGALLEVDGQTVEAAKRFTYKGCMISDVPNFAFAVGYTNASWTLKCDLVSEYVCRIINYIDANRVSVAVPRQRDPEMELVPLLDFNSGYVIRALEILPRQGTRSPWKLYQNYLFDLVLFRHAPLNDGALEFA